ncbi:MAG TPA: hypothetical protein VEV15_11615, partial [Flavisolibacter sp.]|nr:hypothetical protein [Flavisolibacter sp.]
MKRVLLSFFLIACAFFNKVNAQCTISNVSIAPTNVNQSACQVTFDLSYTADLNPGSKYVIVYLWKSSDYTTHTANDYPLPTNQTSTLLGVLIVGNPGKTPVHISTWPADMKKNTEPVAGKIL